MTKLSQIYKILIWHDQKLFFKSYTAMIGSRGVLPHAESRDLKGPRLNFTQLVSVFYPTRVELFIVGIKHAIVALTILSCHAEQLS